MTKDRTPVICATYSQNAPPASAWVAYLFDVTDDGSDPVGLGETEAAAIADLNRQLQEHDR
jgi:hypothetical protein